MCGFGNVSSDSRIERHRHEPSEGMSPKAMQRARLIVSLVALTALLTVGIVLWTLGAKGGNAKMLLAGKVLGGIGIASAALTIGVAIPSLVLLFLTRRHSTTELI